MRLRRIGQCVGLVDLDPDLAGSDHGKKLAAQLLQFLALRRVMHQGRPGNEDRSLLGKQQRIEGRHRAGRIAEADHHAAHAQAVERAP